MKVKNYILCNGHQIYVNTFQPCEFCLPGMVMATSSVDYFSLARHASQARIKENLTNNETWIPRHNGPETRIKKSKRKTRLVLTKIKPSYFKFQ